MLRLVLSTLLFVGVLSQYDGYAQNQITTPSYPRNYHPPAPVHYVNIGANLAGDYKFGYDTGKGPLGQSFREETRLPDGSVQGAYGVLDENGRQRIIRYRAGKNGFTAEGDVGPDGAPKATFPGPAPVAPAHQPAPSYQAPAQQYSAPAQQYNPPQQQYNPPPQQQQQQRARAWNPEVDDPYYKSGPPFIDVERLSYNIGTAKQG